MLFFWISPKICKSNHEMELWAQTKFVVGQFEVVEFNAHIFGVVGYVSETVGDRKIQNLLKKRSFSM